MYLLLTDVQWRVGARALSAYACLEHIHVDYWIFTVYSCELVIWVKWVALTVQWQTLHKNNKGAGAGDALVCMEIETYERRTPTPQRCKKIFTKMFMNIERLEDLNRIKTELVSGIQRKVPRIYLQQWKS